MTNGRYLFGRKVIYTNKSVIDRSNLVEELDKAIALHKVNKSEICYLYDYYKGKQPILYRTKEYNEKVLNKVVENRANEIVSFKVGYLIGEPVQYVDRSNKPNTLESITQLNDYVFNEDKISKDKELAEWFTICGTAYRMVLPNADVDREEDDSPFKIYTLDPRTTFIVYGTDLNHTPMMCVTSVINDDDNIVYSVYTKNSFFKVMNGKIIYETSHSLNSLPIIEYPANPSRLGAFEIVLPLLDAINEVASNRVDGVEQFIQALMIIKGADIDSDDFAKIKELGGLKVPVDGDVSYLIQELNQTQTQTLVNHLYQTVLTICGMPNRNGGASTSDTGTAVIFRDGWESAEARAKDSEISFIKSEKQFLKIALKICSTMSGMAIKLKDIEVRFTRRNYENIQNKSSVLLSMLGSDKIHPKLAFEHSGMFSDPNLAYQMSMEYYEETQKKLEEELVRDKEQEPDVEEDTVVEDEEE